MWIVGLVRQFQEFLDSPHASESIMETQSEGSERFHRDVADAKK